MRDIAFGLRVLLRHPGFTTAAITALALAIGANITVFTLANAFLFKNLPFDDSERILYVSSINTSRPGSARGLSYPDFLDFREQATAFEGLAALASGSVDLSDGVDLPERYRSTLLTANGFAAIGQRPVRGRDFTREDEQPGAPPVVILSYGLWQRRYGLDEAAIGRTVRINDVRTTIIGVMPRGVTFPGTSDLWMPLVRTPVMQRRSSRTLTAFGRLSQTASITLAREQLAITARRLATEYPDTNRDTGVVVQNFNDRFNGGETGRLFGWLLWTVAFVLLIACANVANLLLARAVGRQREVSIRTSLGASRWRVIRQLLVESFLIAIISALFGALLGLWGVQIFDAALVPSVKPPYIDFSIDAHVIAYLVIITATTGIVFGVAPALQLSRLDISSALKDGGNAIGHGRRGRLASAVLVVVEMSLAVVLLAAAGVMIRSLLNTNRAEIGVDARNVLSLNLNLRRLKYPRAADQAAFYDRLKARLESLPGVQVAAVASDLPAESPDFFAYEADGTPAAGRNEPPRAAALIVGEGYFDVMGVRPRTGRTFGEIDREGGAPAAIVNDSFARVAWPGQDAVGKHLRLLGDADQPRGEPLPPGPWLTIVGVVPDILQDDESFEVSPVIYLPFRQRPQGGMEVVVRTRVPPGTLGDAIRREVQTIDDDMAVRALRPLEESFWLRNWRYRIFGTMFAVFAGIALVLASLGLYAVMAQSVSQRTREIGLRMTLGATRRNIFGLVFRQGMLRLAIGLAIGLAGSFWATSGLESMLVGVSPADPMTFAAVATVLTAAGGLGCAVPAGRALRVDPLVALRRE